MGPVGLEMGPEGPVCQKVGGGWKNWFQTQLQRYKKPMLTLRIQGKNFTDMLDTGANISIIRAA